MEENNTTDVVYTLFSLAAAVVVVAVLALGRLAGAL